METIFDKFDIVDPRERNTDANILAEALKEPTEDFKKMPWKDMIKKYDKYSFLSWLTQVLDFSSELMVLAVCRFRCNANFLIAYKNNSGLVDANFLKAQLLPCRTIAQVNWEALSQFPHTSGQLLKSQMSRTEAGVKHVPPVRIKT